ncbi:MAG: peptide-methionine (S)-S-oxide reductase, partial [Candidatus Nanohaloarchaea archaeon]
RGRAVAVLDRVLDQLRDGVPDADVTPGHRPLRRRQLDGRARVVLPGLGGQFTDRGPQYTTAIYAHTPRQYRLAKESKQELNASGMFDKPVVTEILNASTFFRAEDRHQNYSRRNTARYEAYERASGREGFVDRVWGE